MPIFEYSAIDQNGKTIRGSLSGQSLRFAQQELIRRGLNVTQLTPIADQFADQTAESSSEQFTATSAAGTSQNTTAPHPPGAQQGSIHDPDIFSSGVVPPPQAESFRSSPLPALSEFFTQLGSLLNAGVLPYESFQTLARQFPDPTLKVLCNEMASASYAGESFVDVMDRHRGVFSPLMVALMRAGEKGGDLPLACHENARYIREEIEIRRKIRLSTLYPKLQLSAALLIVWGANQIGKMLAGREIFKSPLNDPKIFFPLVLIGIGIWLFLKYGTRNPSVKLKYDRFLLGIPQFGKTSAQFAVAKFGKALGVLYRAGYNPVEALKLAADSCGNDYMRVRLYQAAPALERGEGLGDSLEPLGLLDATVMTMLRTGERTGEVDKMLEHLSTHYEAEAKARAMSSAIVLGLVIAVIVMLYLGYVILTAAMGIIAPYKEAADQVNWILPMNRFFR